MWGLDIMGPFPYAPGRLRYVIVAIDYMTKWAEAKALVHITEQDCRKFFYDQVILRYGIPLVLISDNGPQFMSGRFQEFLADFGIEHRTSSVSHPQSNGQVEVTNRILLRGMEKRLQDAKGRWAEELPKVLWSYRTTPRTSIGETPFKLCYGTKAVIPVEISSPSFRVVNFNETSNSDGMRTNLELLDEVRDQAVKLLDEVRDNTPRETSSSELPKYPTIPTK